MTPLLSVVIPTRNRQKYCIAAIENILSNNELFFELCIQDNSDNEFLSEYIKDNLDDARLKYRYVGEQLNSVHNMNEAISMASGKYVIMLGDDDTVLPSIFKVVEFIDKHNYDAVTQKNIISYNWPDTLYDGAPGDISYYEFRFEKSMPNNSKNINRFLGNGMIDYSLFEFPKVYHGIVKLELLEKTKQITGHFFGGLSPDIFSAVSLSFLTENYLQINYPFSIAGACKKSTTGQNMRTGHRGDISTAPHLYLREDYKWDSRIPKYYSVESIWAETAIKALQELNKDYLSKKFRYSFFVFNAVWRGKSIRKLILKESFNTKNNLLEKINFSLILLFSIIPFVFKKLYQKIIYRKKKKVIRIHDVSNIQSAVDLIMISLPVEFPISEES